MRKKRIALFMVCLAVSLFCLTLSSCGDRFGTDMYGICYVVVPKEYTKMICTTTRTVDSDSLDEELLPREPGGIGYYSDIEAIRQTYLEDEYNIFCFWFEEKSFSSTETYVLDLQYQFYDKDDNITECSQNIVIPLDREDLKEFLPSEIADGVIYIDYGYSQTI